MDIHEDIRCGLEAMGLAASESSVHLLARHLQMVLEGNSRLNLTSIDADQAVALHVLDSATVVPLANEAAQGRAVDLGTGAGYPGIPLCILTGREVALVEAVKKKAVFVESVVADLRLKATVHAVRAEELALEQTEAFAVATARAVAQLPSLVELASPLLHEHGRLLCLKGRADPVELERGDRAAALCGMARSAVIPVTIPGVDARRVIVRYEKLGDPTIKLPRRVGLAQRQPLV